MTDPVTLTRPRALQAVVAALIEQVEVARAQAAIAHDEATNEETRQEGKYDTRATEASYLARGQAWRVAELRRLSAWFAVFDVDRHAIERVGVGSLVQLEGTRTVWVFVSPVGGPKVSVDGEEVRLISPRSPLGAAMADTEEGDCFEVKSPKGPVDYAVLAVL